MLAAITLLGIVLDLLILVGVIAAAVAVMLYAKVHSLSHARVRPCTPEETENHSTLPNKAKAWAEANKFRFLGFYQIGETLVTAWQHAVRPTLFCQYQTKGRTACDFVTAFAGGMWLTTTNAPDGQQLPRPSGKYSQTYPHLHMDDLYQRHTDMEVYLNEQGARFGQIAQSLEDIMNQGMLEQVGYVQSLSLWPMRAIWWYFVRQYQRSGLSIMDQRHLGWILLPNDAAGRTTSPES